MTCVIPARRARRRNNFQKACRVKGPPRLEMNTYREVRSFRSRGRASSMYCCSSCRALLSHRHETLLRTLALDPKIPDIKIRLRDFSHHQFRYAKPRRIEQLYHRAVTQVFRGRDCPQIQQRDDVSLRQCFRQSNASRYRSQTNGRIFPNHPFLNQKPKPSTNSRKAAYRGGARQPCLAHGTEKSRQCLRRKRPERHDTGPMQVGMEFT